MVPTYGCNSSFQRVACHKNTSVWALHYTRYLILSPILQANTLPPEKLVIFGLVQHSKKNFFLFRKISVISPVSELFIYRNIQNLKFGNVLKDTHNGIFKNFFYSAMGWGLKTLMRLVGYSMYINLQVHKTYRKYSSSNCTSHMERKALVLTRLDMFMIRFHKLRCKRSRSRRSFQLEPEAIFSGYFFFDLL